MIELINIIGPDDLGTLVDFIHDEVFELDKVVFNRQASTVEIPFVKEMFDDREVLSGTIIKKVRIPTFRCILKIFEVKECEIVDTQGVGRYDMNSIDFDAGSGSLQIRTGIPLEFRVYVRKVNLKVFRESDPIEYGEKRTLGF